MRWVRERYPTAFHWGYPADVEVHAVLEDVIIRLRARPDGITTLEELGVWFCAELQRTWEELPACTHYVVRFERPAAVPAAKEITHRRRYGAKSARKPRAAAAAAVVDPAAPPPEDPVAAVARRLADLRTAAGVLPEDRAGWNALFSDQETRRELVGRVTALLLRVYTPPLGRTLIVDAGWDLERDAHAPTTEVYATMSPPAKRARRHTEGGTLVEWSDDESPPPTRIRRERGPLGPGGEAGEAELAVYWWAAQPEFAGRNCMIRSTDGDAVLAALLGRDELLGGGHRRRRLLVDRGWKAVPGPTADAAPERRRQVVDVATLCAAIAADAELAGRSGPRGELEPGTDALCALILSEDSDYVDKVAQVSFARLMEAYQSMGEIRRGQLLLVRTRADGTRRAWVRPDGWLELCRRAYALRWKKDGAPGSRWTLDALLAKYAKSSTGRDGLARRRATLSWALSYMMDAWRPTGRVPDEFQRLDGRSVYGFERHTLAEGQAEPPDWFGGVFWAADGTVWEGPGRTVVEHCGLTISVPDDVAPSAAMVGCRIVAEHRGVIISAFNDSMATPPPRDASPTAPVVEPSADTPTLQHGEARPARLRRDGAPRAARRAPSAVGEAPPLIEEISLAPATRARITEGVDRLRTLTRTVTLPPRVRDVPQLMALWEEFSALFTGVLTPDALAAAGCAGAGPLYAQWHARLDVDVGDCELFNQDRAWLTVIEALDQFLRATT